MTKELIAEALQWANGHPNRRSSELMRALAEALEVRQPSEEGEYILRLIETIKQTGGSVEVSGVKIMPCDEFGRTAAVPDAATEGDYHEGLEEGIKIGRAERAAALAALERVRAEADAYAEQPDVMEPCGAVAQALRTALDGAPEPETPELFPGTNAALDRLTVRKAAPAEAFCIEHGNFHAVELGDPTCEFEDGFGEPVDGEKP